MELHEGVEQASPAHQLDGRPHGDAALAERLQPGPGRQRSPGRPFPDLMLRIDKGRRAGDPGPDDTPRRRKHGSLPDFQRLAGMEQRVRTAVFGNVLRDGQGYLFKPCIDAFGQQVLQGLKPGAALRAMQYRVGDDLGPEPKPAALGGRGAEEQLAGPRPQQVLQRRGVPAALRLRHEHVHAAAFDQPDPVLAVEIDGVGAVARVRCAGRPEAFHQPGEVLSGGSFHGPLPGYSAETSSRYRPSSAAISSSCRPRCVIRPPTITMISSQSRMALKRCATMRQAQPRRRIAS